MPLLRGKDKPPLEVVVANLDDSFIATESMTEAEIYEMKKALYEHAKNELEKVCFPQFTMRVDSINFPKIFRFEKFSRQIELGCFITISLDDIHWIEARLLKMEFNWDDPNDFSLTFSSRKSLEDGVFSYADMQYNVDKIGTSLNISSSAWNNASKNSATVLTDMSTFLNASLREVQNSQDNEVNMDGTGITVRKSNGDGTYDPYQLWMTRGNIVLTDDAWKSVKIAIGTVNVNGKKIAGIAAPLIIGTQYIGENMQIVNQNNTLTMGADGFVAKSKNGYSLVINPDNPSEIFVIKNGTNTILGVDAATNKFVFKGTLESTDGKIGGWTIGNTALVSGTVGLSSSGNVRMWAGSTDQNAAPFKVMSDGSITTSKFNCTGGTMKIGNGFEVSANGKLKCSGADISGHINALTGKIGGFNINGNDLSVASGSGGAKIDFGNDVFIDDTGLVVGNWWISNEEISSINAIIANADGDLIVNGSKYYDGWTVARALDDLRSRIGSGGGGSCGSQCGDSGDSCSSETTCTCDCDGDSLECDIECASDSPVICSKGG